MGKLLGQVGGVDDVSITEAVRRHHDRPARVDEVTLARIGRDREEAGRRLAKTRDVATWQREMAQLDAEEQAAHEPVAAGRLSSGEIVDYLRSLPSLWADAGPDGRQALATALFARTDVMGFARLEYELTPEAIELGLDAALPAMFELSCTIAEFGRGERRQTTLRHLNVPANLPLKIEVTGADRWLSRSIVERVQPQKIAVGSASISASKEPTSGLGSMRT